MKCPYPGEVYKVDLGIEGKVRPMIVVSRYDEEAPRLLAMCVPITTKDRGSQYEVRLPKLKFLRYESYANVQGLQPVVYKDLLQKVGKLEPRELGKIQEALRYALDLS